jgi:3-oxoacyl-[acyl-carrier protein] reductase
MSKRLEGARALVTGGSRGIGFAIASILHREGARVYIVGRDRERLERAAAAIASGESRSPGDSWTPPAELSGEVPGARARAPVALPADLGEPSGPGRLVEQLPEDALDILINNAGVARNMPLEETSDEEWEFHFKVNVEAPFRLMRDLLPRLRRGSNPAVVNIGSVVSSKGYVNQGAYTASKHALLGLTKVFAKEVHGDGIRVFSVEPGGVDTEMIRTMRPEIDEALLSRPEEVAETVLSLILMTGGAMIDRVQLRRAAKEPWQ